MTGFALGCLALLFAIAVRDYRRLPVGQVFLLLIVTSVAFLLEPRVAPSWRWLMADLQTALPALFWWLCLLIFARRPRWRPLWAAVACYSVLAPALARPLVATGQAEAWVVFVGFRLGQYCEYALLAHGLLQVVSHWRDDLVETRRRARLGFLLVVGSTVSVAAVCLNTGLYTDSLRSLLTAPAAFITLLCLVQARDGMLALAQPQPQSAIPPSEPLPATTVAASPQGPPGAPGADEASADADQLGKLMASGFYRTERLTLRKLADASGLPEYRLRRAINQHLGYRNFNDYINQLRVADAARRLLAEPDLPVLNISLDVGYRTLSSFNRAFREIMATTPTDYRQAGLTSPAAPSPSTRQASLERVAEHHV